MDTAAFLHDLRTSAFYRDQIVHVEHLPYHEAQYATLDNSLPHPLYSQLEQSGMAQLYTHQAAALQAARSGKNVMVATPSASGKTLCYNLPVLEAILAQKGNCALYLFPTKALAHDQLRNLKELVSSSLPHIRYATFDGDTAQQERSEIKKRANIVLTNPDMLHVGILPNHSSWSRLFRNLTYVVIDEAHIYRGVFGSHMSNILRRLRRICARYNAHPQFICCSATIANPQEHIERLVGLPFETIEDDGAPHVEKDFIFWNPPLIDESKTTRRSANSEASFLFSELVKHGIRTLTFARTRKLTELIYNYSKERLGPQLSGRISPYRAGYLPEERREIEQKLSDGQLLGAVATTALELGIDIGDLEATVLTGYPGSIASTWQQAGRSGRRGDKSTSFLIGLDNPLDQYFMRRPDFFFHKNFENVLTNPDNHYIMNPHVLCAAWEFPLSEADQVFFGSSFAEAQLQLEKEGMLKKRGNRSYPSASIQYPSDKVNIRSTSSYSYTIFDSSHGNRLLETVEAAVAPQQIHPGAIYLHRGDSYLITELDMVAHSAYAVPTDLPYYTQARELTELQILELIQEKTSGSSKVCLGRVEVTTTVVTFRKKMQFIEEVIGEEPLDLPPQSFETIALWFNIPAEAIDQLVKAQLDLAGGLHAAEHAAIAMLPIFALCDRNDIGGVSTPFHPDTGNPQVFIYDAHPGGIGIAEKGFELVENLWSVTLNTIEECPCEDGCPSCIQSPKCGNNNDPLDKKAAAIILERLLYPHSPVEPGS